MGGHHDAGEGQFGLEEVTKGVKDLIGFAGPLNGLGEFQ